MEDPFPAGPLSSDSASLNYAPRSSSPVLLFISFSLHGLTLEPIAHSYLLKLSSQRHLASVFLASFVFPLSSFWWSVTVFHVGNGNGNLLFSQLRFDVVLILFFQFHVVSVGKTMSTILTMGQFYFLLQKER